MSFNKKFKLQMRKYEWMDTFAGLHGSKNPNKKLSRKQARRIFKQEKFYEGFEEFMEEQRNGSK